MNDGGNNDNDFEEHNPPTKIKINGVKVDIFWVDTDEDLKHIIPGERLGDAVGYAITYPKLAIVVDKEMLKMNHDLPRMTLIHEMLHLVSDLNGLGLTEKQVLGLETGLYGVFKENQGFLEFLFDKGQER